MRRILHPPGKKICSSCKTAKQLDLFSSSRDELDGYAHACISCNRNRGRKYRMRNKDKIRARSAIFRNANREHVLKQKREYDKIYRSRPGYPLADRFRNIKQKYGLTAFDYNRLLASQEAKCAICNTSLNDLGKKRMVIDHCHKTKKVRGLLCTTCNLGIGYSKESVDILQNMIAYLQKHNTKQE